MKIATFNISGVRRRLQILRRWLAEAKPDIVCLQELKVSQSAFPEKELQEAGYSAVWVGQSNWNGVAILARGSKPVLARRGLRDGDEDTQARYIEAAVGEVLICCLYAPNGNKRPGQKFDYKLDWLSRLEAHAGGLMDVHTPAIMIGNFNIIPTELDVHSPERWVEDALFDPDARASFARLCATGWVDAIRKRYPHEQVYTFWDHIWNACGRTAGSRLDHILLSPPLAPKLLSAGVDAHVRDWIGHSDHAPAWIELKQVEIC